MPRYRFRLRPAAALGLLALLLPSCNTAGGFKPIPESGASLSGTVSFKHELLHTGLVLVQGANAGSQGRIHEDGHYTIDNVPLGEVTLVVTMGPARGEALATAAAQRAKGERVVLPKIVNLPAKYGDAAASPLKTNIQKGENSFDIAMN